MTTLPSLRLYSAGGIALYSPSRVEHLAWLGVGMGRGAHLAAKTRAVHSRERQNSPAQQHAKSQISPTVRPRASNEGAFDRLASWSTQLAHRLVAGAASSLRYLSVARRKGLY